MGKTLTDTWKLHALPNENPARELVWAEESERHRNEERRDIYLELSGAGMKIDRFTNKKRNDAAAKAARGRAFHAMLLAIGSPAYQTAYDNKLSFNIDGEEFEITQGELHERAKKHAQDLRRQIEEAKERGVGADELTRLQQELLATNRIVENTDPQRDTMDDKREKAVRDDLRKTPGLRDLIRQEHPNIAPEVKKPQSTHTARSLDSDATTRTKLTDWSSRSSVADRVQDSPFAAITIKPKSDFAVAATADHSPTQDKPQPETPDKSPGFNLG